MNQILIAGNIGKLSEQSGKMKLGKAGKVGKLVAVNVFCAVVGDIVADHHKFLYIFMLLTIGNAGEFGIGIEVRPAKQDEKLYHQGIKACLRKGEATVIFTADFLQTVTKPPVQLRIIRFCYQSIRMQRMKQGIHSFYVANQTVIK